MLLVQNDELASTDQLFTIVIIGWNEPNYNEDS
jgi:hypothetical protein